MVLGQKKKERKKNCCPTLHPLFKLDLDHVVCCSVTKVEMFLISIIFLNTFSGVIWTQL